MSTDFRQRGVATQSSFYGLRGTHQPKKQKSLGAFAGLLPSSSIKQDAGIPSNTNDEVNQSSRWTAKGKLGWSNAVDRNQLTFGMVTYLIDHRNSVNALAYRIGDHASIAGGSAYPIGNDGQRYFWDHQLGHKLALQLYHEINHQIYGAARSETNWVTLSWNFRWLSP